MKLSAAHRRGLLEGNVSHFIRKLCSCLVALLWLTSVHSAEICNGAATKTFTQEAIDQSTSCTVTGSIAVGPGVSVDSGATLSLYAHRVGFTGLVTIASGGGLRVGSSQILNDTGITSCSNADTNGLACPVAGYPDQDAEYGRDVTDNDDSDGHAGFSFTKLDANGNSLPASATSWSCVKDNVTGLIWEVKTDDNGIHDRDNTYRWGGKTAQGSGYGTYYDDWNSLVDGSNAESLCGYADWRVPTLAALRSLVDYSRYDPAIDTDFFPNTRASGFWSAGPDAAPSNYAWYVRFDDGGAGASYRSNGLHLRLVRSGQ